MALAARRTRGSLLLRPACSLSEAASLSLVVALAVAEAVHDVSGGLLAPPLKWPNDVLVGPAKLAGILLEGAEGPGRRAAWVVIGLGVDLRHHPQDTPLSDDVVGGGGRARVDPCGLSRGGVGATGETAGLVAGAGLRRLARELARRGRRAR